MPALADFELYLHEVSGSWLTDMLAEGVLRMYSADPDAINGYALEGGEAEGEDLPRGSILEGIAEDGNEDGWQRFWLGHTPETAADGNEPLVYLLLNRKTDEILAYRTSVTMRENGEEPVKVSLYIWRDRGSDLAGEVKYNVMFFDTPERRDSVVKVITDILEGYELNVQASMQIRLRAWNVEGADMPAYGLLDYFFAMKNGTDDAPGSVTYWYLTHY